MSLGCDKSYQMPKWNGPDLKRKRSIEHQVNLLKKLKINGANSGTCPDFRGDILSVSSCTLDLWGSYEHMKWSSQHVFAPAYSSFFILSNFKYSQPLNAVAWVAIWNAWEWSDSGWSSQENKRIISCIFFLLFFGNFH